MLQGSMQADILVSARSCCALRCWAPRGTQGSTSLCFYSAHPAHECAPAVLQLSRDLWRQGRGSDAQGCMH